MNQEDKLVALVDTLVGTHARTTEVLGHEPNPSCWLDYANAIRELVAENVRLTAATAQQAERQANFDKLYADAMVAHRWFAAHFGDSMNGRDFADKCPMAEAQLAQQAEASARLTLERDSAREQFDKHVQWAASQADVAEAQLAQQADEIARLRHAVGAVLDDDAMTDRLYGSPLIDLLRNALASDAALSEGTRT